MVSATANAAVRERDSKRGGKSVARTGDAPLLLDPGDGRRGLRRAQPHPPRGRPEEPDHVGALLGASMGKALARRVALQRQAVRLVLQGGALDHAELEEWGDSVTFNLRGPLDERRSGAPPN